MRYPILKASSAEMGAEAEPFLHELKTRIPTYPYKEPFHHNQSSTGHHCSAQDFTPATTPSNISSSSAPFREEFVHLVDACGFKSAKQAYEPLAQSDDVEVRQLEEGIVDSAPSPSGQALAPTSKVMASPHVHCKECTELVREREERECCLSVFYVLLGMLGMVMVFGMICVIAVANREQSVKYAPQPTAV